MQKSNGWFRWFIGTLIALLAAGSGIVALLTYFHQQPTLTPTPTPATDTCIQGYVWREVVPSDHVCVTPATRAQAQYDNSQVQYRVIHP